LILSKLKLNIRTYREFQNFEAIWRDANAKQTAQKQRYLYFAEPIEKNLLSKSQLAKKYKCSRNSIDAVLKRYENGTLIGKPGRRHNPKYTIWKAARIKSMQDEGYSYRAISETTGIPKSTIYDVVHSVYFKIAANKGRATLANKKKNRKKNES
jgi:transposase